MKTAIWYSLGVAALVTAGFSPKAQAGIFSDDFEMIAVAESAKSAPPLSKEPVSYVAFDGGYIEAGDPIAGESPPSADLVRQELQAALSANGFQATQGTPSLVLTYYWGVLRVDSAQIKVPYGIKTNLRARIALVSTAREDAEVENYILGREKGSSMDMDAATPTLNMGPLETVLQNSRLARYFLIVSAYDYQALAQQHEPKLVWRTKLSAQESAGGMSEVIPSIIAAGGPYFGKNMPDVKIVNTSLSKVQPVTGAEMPNVSPDSVGLDAKFLQGLMKREHTKVSGMSD
jgi:hypothetical protein